MENFVNICEEAVTLPEPIGKLEDDRGEFTAHGLFENLLLEDDSLGALVTTDLLSQVINPLQVMAEIHRVLKPNGCLVAIFTPPDDADHIDGQCRFSCETVWFLLKNFRTKVIFYQGKQNKPHTIWALASKALWSTQAVKKIVKKVQQMELAGTVPPVSKLLLKNLHISASHLRDDCLKTPEPCLGDDNIKGCIDIPSDKHVSFQSGDIVIEGWVWSPNPIEKLDLFCDDEFIGNPMTGLSRQDVAQSLDQAPGSSMSGFRMVFSPSNLAHGPHTISLSVTLKERAPFFFHSVSFYYFPASSQRFEFFRSAPLFVDGRLARYQQEADASSKQNVEERLGITSQTNRHLTQRKEKPKIVLVHPPFISDPDNPSTHDCVVIHGLGLILSYARRRGYDIDLIDNRDLNNWDLFRDRLADSGADIVGIGSSTVDYFQARQCIDMCKEILPKAKVVIGGPHPSLATEEVAANDNIDHILIGDGEITFVDLVEAIGAGYTPKRIIHGQRVDLDSMPFVERDIFSRKEHLMSPLWFGESPWVSMITSRGCMFNCAFCAPASKIMFGRSVRRRSPEHVINELIQLYDKYAFKHVRFYDDNIIEDPKWAHEFCELYKEQGFTSTFGIAGRADLICKREGLMAELAETGMNELNIGFESGSQRILDLLNKKTTVEQNIKAAEILKKLGVKVIVSVMFGIPSETNEDIIKTIEMLDKVQPDWIDPSFLTPYPGTVIHEYCQDQEINLIKNSESYMRDFGSNPKIKGVNYDFAIKTLGNRAGLRT